MTRGNRRQFIQGPANHAPPQAHKVLVPGEMQVVRHYHPGHLTTPTVLIINEPGRTNMHIFGGQHKRHAMIQEFAAAMLAGVDPARLAIDDTLQNAILTSAISMTEKLAAYHTEAERLAAEAQAQQQAQHPEAPNVRSDEQGDSGGPSGAADSPIALP